MVKLDIMPSVIPSGLRLPACEETERIIGNKGQMHGARIVTKPARKVKRSNISILPSIVKTMRYFL